MQLTLSRTLIFLCGLGGLAAVAACSDGTSFSSIAPTPGGFPGPRPRPPPSDPNEGPGEVSPCPGEPPDDGAACDAPSSFATCRYGPDVRDECSDTFVCENRRWTRTAGTCATSCPSRFEDLPIGAACADDSVACSYDEGTCGCVGEAGPDAGAVDAGDPDGGHGLPPPPKPGVWKCAPPPSEPACPSARPQVLDPCVKQVQCDYGTCALGRPLLWFCDSDRRWSGPVTRKCDP